MSEELGDSGVYPWELKPGARVGRWCVVEPLGSGSYGAVYRVVEAADPEGRSYALKLALRPSDVRAEREVELLALTEHPHVVRVHAWGQWRSPAGLHLYFVMDWIQGLPLHTWVETANPPLSELVRVASTLALTLDWLHARGVRHRDLKPEHILIRASDAQPLLIDFGVGRQEGASTLTSTVVPPGTLHLRSPEAVDFHRLNHDDPRARYVFQPTDDLYALGVCLFRALTGHYPFPTDVPVDLLMLAILAHVPPPVAALNPRVPSALSAVVARLLEKKPQARFGTGRELHQALEAARRLGPAWTWEVRVFPRAQPPPPRPPMTPATPAREGDPGGTPTAPRTGRRVVGVAMLPVVPSAGDAENGLTLLRLDTGAPPRGRVAEVTRRRGGSRSRRAWVPGLAVVLALVTWLVVSRSDGPEPLSSTAREAGPPRTGVRPGGPPEAGEGAAPLVERALTADAEPMTQPMNSSEVKPSLQSSLPAEKPRPKTSSAARGAARAAVLACVGAACSSPQQVAPASGTMGDRQVLTGRKPPPEECPPGALEAMKELQFGRVGHNTPDVSVLGYEGRTAYMPVRDGPVVLDLNRELGTLPRWGTTVSGRFFFFGGRVYGWFTGVHTEDGRSYPICMELLDEDRNRGWAQVGLGDEPGTVLVRPVGQLRRVQRFQW